MSTNRTCSKRTLTKLLRKYGLENDYMPLWRCGFRNADDMQYMEEDHIIRLKLKGTLPTYKRTRWRVKTTFRAYMHMYNQETGNCHPDSKKSA